jgi:hypothetical protein
MLKEFGFCNGGNKGSKVGSRPVLIQAGGKGVICPREMRPDYMHES